MVKRIEMDGPQTRKLMKKVETGDGKVRELVIQTNDPKVGKVWKLARFGQEEHKKSEHDAMLAGAREEEEVIRCYDDTSGKELLWQAVKQAREQELKYLRELGVYEKVDELAAVAKYNITPFDRMWVDTDKAFEGGPMQIVHELLPEKSSAGTGQTCMGELLRLKLWLPLYSLLRVTVQSSH